MARLLTHKKHNENIVVLYYAGSLYEADAHREKLIDDHATRETKALFKN